MKTIYAVLAVAWFGLAMMYEIKEKDKETALLIFIIGLQYQSLFYQRDNREKKE